MNTAVLPNDGPGGVENERSADAGEVRPSLIPLRVARRPIHIPSEVMETFIRQFAEATAHAITPCCSCCGDASASDVGGSPNVASTKKGSSQHDD
jgi:hypothetical protein